MLDKQDSPDWDAPTRSLLRQRLEEVPAVRFFTEQEVRTLQAAADRIVPQPERSAPNKVPIVPWIDEKLFHDRRDGYRYEDMPPQREAWRRGLAGIEETASAMFGRAFVSLEGAAQDAVLRAIEGGAPPGTAWASMPAARFFNHLLLQTIVKTFYAHPLAWNETGYSGPSALRGHVRKGVDAIDPWEARMPFDRRPR